MAWRVVCSHLARYRELVPAAVFVGLASYELLEMWAEEPVAATGRRERWRCTGAGCS